ncbi:MAG: 2-oxo-4-hydroxy-4-carboxy-5-ureidoimidazoline decarboxylase, partial [Steroidobacteraceae bacterium]
MITLAALNETSPQEFVATLATIYEHSAWVPQRILHLRPFASVAALHAAMASAVGAEGTAAQ